MRIIVIFAAALLLAGFVLAMAPPTWARPSPVCADPKAAYGGGSCGGLVCVDENLDGRFSGGECAYFLCPEYGCCTFDCPPPPYE